MLCTSFGLFSFSLVHLNPSALLLYRCPFLIFHVSWYFCYLSEFQHSTFFLFLFIVIAICRRKLFTLRFPSACIMLAVQKCVWRHVSLSVLVSTGVTSSSVPIWIAFAFLFLKAFKLDLVRLWRYINLLVLFPITTLQSWQRQTHNSLCK